MNDLQADEMITAIRELQADRNRFEAIANGKIVQIEESLNLKKESIEKEVQFMKDQLQGYFTTVKKKESKTQESYSLLSGKLVMKKATQKIAHDDEKLKKYLDQDSDNRNKYLNKSILIKLDWAGLKKDLSIKNGMITNSVTGEVLEDTGITLEDVQASFDIK